eukprot:7610955-Karenia_brevis.AAC.1
MPPSNARPSSLHSPGSSYKKLRHHPPTARSSSLNSSVIVPMQLAWSLSLDGSDIIPQIVRSSYPTSSVIIPN